MSRWLPILLAGLVFGSTVDLSGAGVGLIKVDGVIGPATANYIGRAISVSAARGDVCLIIQLDTPGGLLESTKQIVLKLYASGLPTIVYVAPSGASAGSAGCFITLAADIAAMAPHSRIGAAHPVSIGAGGAENAEGVMKQKLENDAASFIKSIAEKRGRNVEWARASVLQSESITAEEALELKVIDLIAEDVPDLLKKLEGREAKEELLHTAGTTVAEIPMAMYERLFQLLARPEIMLILMLAATYGIIGELSSPGAILPGVVGGIALILSLYMASVLPVNTAGLALMGLALLLFVIDLFAPTHGVLTFGGIVSFFLGALMLFNGAGPGFGLSLGYIIPATLLTAAFFIFVIGAGVRAQLQPARTGKESMVGKLAPAVERIDLNGGRVLIDGEYWNAISDVPVPAGDPVQIVGLTGLTLKVKPKQTGALTAQKA